MMRRVFRVTADAFAVLSLTLAISAIAMWWPGQNRTVRTHVVAAGPLTLCLILPAVSGVEAHLYLDRPETTLRARSNDLLDGGPAFPPWPNAGWWSRSFGYRVELGPLPLDAEGVPDWRSGIIWPNVLQDIGTAFPMTSDVRGRVLSVPSGAIVTALLVVPAIRTGTLAIDCRRRRMRMRMIGRCRACGYDLRASPDRCPECGTVTAA